VVCGKRNLLWLVTPMGVFFYSNAGAEQKKCHGNRENGVKEEVPS